MISTITLLGPRLRHVECSHSLQRDLHRGKYANPCFIPSLNPGKGKIKITQLIDFMVG
jgi:hypothetical protein